MAKVQYKEHNKICATPNRNPLMEPQGVQSDKPDDPTYRKYSDGNYKAVRVDTEAQYNGFSEDDLY